MSEVKKKIGRPRSNPIHDYFTYNQEKDVSVCKIENCPRPELVVIINSFILNLSTTERINGEYQLKLQDVVYRPRLKQRRNADFFLCEEHRISAAT